jgi:CubicO group peptidase (beta-lactamase class C family)
MHELPRTRAAIEKGIAQGLHPGAQLCVACDDRVLTDAALGESRPGVAMTPDSLTLWMSSCKPITAIAVAQQWEQGILDLDAPVAEAIPEFAQGNKGEITPRHLLTHTGGFRSAMFRIPEDSWDTILERICATRLEPRWVPGERAGYHAETSWFILAELVQRATGRPYSEHVRESVLEPTGMADSWLGMPASEYARYGERIAFTMNMSQSPPRPLGWEDESRITRTRPSGNGYGPAHDLAAFYRMLLRGGTGAHGARVVGADTVRAFTSRQREGMKDRTFGTTLDWGLGFILDSKRYGQENLPYGYGPSAPDSVYGHSGFQSSVAFADPEHALAVALVFNGCPGDQAHYDRVHEVLGALYRDLGLA